MSPTELDEYLAVIKRHKIENIKLVFGGIELIVTGLIPPDMIERSVVKEDYPDSYSAIDSLKDD